MKKLLAVFLFLGICLSILSVYRPTSYSVREAKAIELASEMVERQYDIDLRERDYKFSIGRQISENKFVAMDSKDLSEGNYKNIISVSAMKKKSHKKGELYAYAITFNMDTKEVKSITAKVGE